MANEETLRNELEALKAENTRLREFNSILQAQRKEYLDMMLAGSDRYSLDEQEVTEQMRDSVPFGRILNELGIRRLERP